MSRANVNFSWVLYRDWM